MTMSEAKEELNPVPCSTGHLYGVGLDLRMCASCWDGDARLLGNIKASELTAMANDYIRLRLESGVSDVARKYEDSELSGMSFEAGWKAAVSAITKGLSDPEVRDDLLEALSS